MYVIESICSAMYVYVRVTNQNVIPKADVKPLYALLHAITTIYKQELGQHRSARRQLRTCISYVVGY